MSSELEKLAQAIRVVGDRAGPVNHALDSAKLTARRLAAAVPRTGSAGSAAGSLSNAAICCEQASRELHAFGDGCRAFAERLVGGGPGASGATDRAAASSASTGNDPENAALVDALAAKGLELGAVDDFDYTDNPLLDYRKAPAEDIAVRTAPLNHPNGATGYRVDYRGKSICYITDTEHREGQRDRTIVELCRGADVMIYDSSYTDEEYARYRGWGHSTWQEGVRLADAAGVGTLAIFHHDPSHDDAFMDGVAREAALLRPGTAANGLPRVIVSHEGLTLSP